MSTKAAEKRYTAIQAIVTRFLPESTGYTLVEGTTKEDVAKAFAELADLGRTDRWKASSAKWSDEALAGQYDLDWVIRQGAIAMGWVAE